MGLRGKMDWLLGAWRASDLGLGEVPLGHADPQPPGTAAPGSTGNASDEGHVHPLPTLAQLGVPKGKYDATAAPGVDDDSGDGYSAGSMWVKVNATVGVYVCVDATAGAAVWKQLTLVAE